MKKIRSGVTAISFRAFWPKNETTRRVLMVGNRGILKQQQLDLDLLRKSRTLHYITHIHHRTTGLTKSWIAFVQLPQAWTYFQLVSCASVLLSFRNLLLGYSTFSLSTSAVAPERISKWGGAQVRRFFYSAPSLFKGARLSGGAQCMFGRAHIHCFVLKTGLQMKPL